jgi:hypothetical protein
MTEIILELDLDEETRAAIEQATGGDPDMIAALVRMAIVEYGESEVED